MKLTKEQKKTTFRNKFYGDESPAPWPSRPQDEKEWVDLNAFITGVAPLRNNFHETAHFHAPSVNVQVNEIMKELPVHLTPFVEGTPIGAYPGPAKRIPEPPLDVQRALRYLRVVRRVNGSIHDLRRKGLGLAQHMKYLVLDKDQERIINTWRREYDLGSI
jgi:hypothetical protein